MESNLVTTRRFLAPGEDSSLSGSFWDPSATGGIDLLFFPRLKYRIVADGLHRLLYEK